ncbi:hypothetical protein FQN57_002169 [Myotisia sp. PD_48]|nr:hypothetical protein FQN57_002169 [Myotisia sp. PD_48]
MASIINLGSLPDEILHSILCFATPSATLALQQAAHRFENVTNAPLLWRNFCKVSFRYWDRRHNIAQKFASPAGSVRWKDLYKSRHLIDAATTRLLDSILSSQVGRIEKTHKIVSFGYDTKDTLLRHADAEPEQDDYLARSNAILGCLHRTVAIPEWIKLRNGERVPLEYALGAFDMFVVESRPGDLDDILQSLDDIVGRISHQYPSISDSKPREKAILIAQFLRSNNLTGIEAGREYHNIEHNFIGVALMNDGHNSLPLISAAIYCYVAQQLGLKAEPCGFPFHVYVIIRPERQYDLDGNSLPDSEEGVPMYMDPFRSVQETPVSELWSQLDLLGGSTRAKTPFLSESPTPEIVLRCGKNILNSVLQSHHSRRTSLDIVNVKYAALWASMLLANYTNPDTTIGAAAGGVRPRLGHIPLRRHLPSLMEHFATEFPSDVYLVEQYLTPLFRGLPEYDHLRDNVNAMKAGDEIPKQIRHRSPEYKNVKYKVGQLFRHRRYDYMGLVTGWDPECGAEEQWMQRMAVDSLHGGRHQSFYYVLVEDKSVRYVAEENIEVTTPSISEIPCAFFNFAGKHFKRWDSATCTFVSNIRDEYPDD